jgi:hypothetical protein
MTIRTSVIAVLVAVLPLTATAKQSREAPAAAHSGTVWKPADTPPGGISWALLESTGETTRRDKEGYIIAKPVFPPAVLALAGKTVKVAGYMMPLQNGRLQTHFVLLAYPPDCPFHLNPNPMQFIEVRTTKPMAFDYEVKTIEGTLELTGYDESGVFFRIADGRLG